MSQIRATQPVNSEESYLDKLVFDRKLYGSMIYRLITNSRAVFLFILSIIIGGLFAFSTLPRELNPEVEIPIVMVTTALPGANPIDVEELITNKLEKEINTIAGIDDLSSTSRDGVSMIVAFFVSNADPDKALAEVRERVGLVTDLPEDATVPRVAKLDFNDIPVTELAIVGDMDRRSLSNLALEMQERVEALSAVRRVDLAGQETEEIVIEVSPELMQTFGVSASQISQAISANNLTFPAGVIQINQTQYQVSVDSSIDSIDQLRSIPIGTGGQSVLLGDIAEVFFGAVPTDSLTFYSTRDERSLGAIQLSVYKSGSATISQAASEARAVIDELSSQYPQLEVVTITDYAEEIETQFRDLSFNFRDTIFLVFLTLFIFIGLKQALIASLSIPLTFLSVFVIMQLAGITLNFLSLFSLLLALGLVVDDAIVIVQAAYRYSQKFKPIEAGLLVFRDFSVPILTTTLTKIWAFLPLLLATGIIGEFIKSIPIVVTSTLVASTTVAVFINLPLVVILSQTKIPRRVKFLIGLVGLIASSALIVSIFGNSPLMVAVLLLWWLSLGLVLWSRQELALLLRQRLVAIKKNQRVRRSDPANIIARSWRKFRQIDWQQVISFGVIDFSKIALSYRKVLTKIVRRRRYRGVVYGLSTALLLISFIFLGTGLLKTDFFPKTDQKQIYVNVEGPAGWPLESTLEVLSQVEEIVLEYDEVRYIVTRTNGLFMGESGSHLGNITVVLPDLNQRDKTSMEIADDLRDRLSEFGAARVSVEEMAGGPPVGADLEISIRGQDFSDLEVVSGDFMAILEDIEGAINIDTTLKQSAGQVRVILNPIALNERGLNAAQVGGWLRTAVSGSRAGDAIINQQEYDLTLRLSDDLVTLSYLKNLIIPSPTGQYALSELAAIELATSPTVIRHQDMLREVRVTAAASGVSAPELLSSFEQAVSDYQLPTGITWQVGGVNQENEASTRSILQAMLLSSILILITMVLQLNSFRKAVIVLAVIPLAVSGVFVNFTLLGVPLSFPALIGVLALFGIVVNNSIILIDKINQNLRYGLPFVSAIVDACSTRIEAIFFTSVTTTIGLLPITIADPFWRGLGGAIIAGLSVSGLFILFLLPALYVELYQHSDENKVRST